MTEKEFTALYKSLKKEGDFATLDNLKQTYVQEFNGKHEQGQLIRSIDRAIIIDTMTVCVDKKMTPSLCYVGISCKRNGSPKKNGVCIGIFHQDITSVVG